MKEDFVSFAVAVIAAVIITLLASCRLAPYSALSLGIIFLMVFATFVPINSHTMMPLLALYFASLLWLFAYVIFKALRDVRADACMI